MLKKILSFNGMNTLFSSANKEEILVSYSYSQNFYPKPNKLWAVIDMSRVIVVYRSISGFTKRYAQWIAEELTADFCDARKIEAQTLRSYDVVVFGGSLHASGIIGLNLIKDNAQLLAGKKIVVFAVGASLPSEQLVEEVKKYNFPKSPDMKLFYLRGGFNFDKLDQSSKVLMMLFKARIKIKKQKTPDEEEMLAAYDIPLDCTKKESVQELVEYVKSLL